jgi:hypothetical protein
MLSLILVQPLSSDNAVLQSIAYDWFYKASVPYLQAWDQTFPGIIFIHLASILLFGPTAVGFRVFDIFIHVAFVYALYGFLTRWLHPFTASLAIILYIAYYVAGGWYVYGRPDDYGMMTVIYGLAILLKKEHPSLRRVVLAGMVIGLSFVLRPTFLLYSGFAALFVLYRTQGSWAHRMSHGAIAFLAALIPLALVVLFYSTKPNGVNELFTSTIRWNIDLYTGLGGLSLWPGVLRTGLLIPFAALGLFLPANPRIVHRTFAVDEKILWGATLLGTLFILILMGKYWPYQFPPLYLCIIPFSAIGLQGVRLQIATRWRRRAFTFFAILGCSFVAYNPGPLLAFGSAAFHEEDPFEAATAARMKDPSFAYQDQKAVLSYLNSADRAASSVEIWTTFKPWLRLALGTRPVGPYVTFHGILFRTGIIDGEPTYTSYQRTWQQHYVHILENTPPQYLVVEENSQYWYLHDLYNDGFKYLPGLDSFFRSNYSSDTNFGNFHIYKRTR